jgi:hypothetical protein
MVDCYIALHKMRNAVTAASNCCKQMNNHPKALTVSINFINNLYVIYIFDLIAIISLMQKVVKFF